MAVQQDRFQIFVSHKHADTVLAQRVARELERLGGGGLIRCWWSGEDILAGDDWRENIRKGLADSHLLILLFTEPGHTWDWCLYEVGLFMRFDAEDVREVVCLFDPAGAPPGPLTHVQGVPATADSIHRLLLEPLVREPWRVSDDWLQGPLLHVTDEEFADKHRRTFMGAARRIAAAFDEAARAGKQHDVYYPCHRVVLDFAGCEVEPARGIPLDASVVLGADGTDGYTLALFGSTRNGEQPTWGDLVAGVGGPEARWREQLDTQFAAACEHRLFNPMIDPFPNWLRNHLYRPMLAEVTMEPGTNRPTGASIVLIRDSAPPIVGGPAFNILRSNTRYRTEVFEEFGTDIGDRLGAADDPDDVYREIAGAFARVEAEAEALDVFTETQVRAAYGDDYEASGVRELERDWLAARERLDVALGDRNRSGVEKGLTELAELNHEFTARAAERYRKVVVGES